jgi:hypothetical protein
VTHIKKCAIFKTNCIIKIISKQDSILWCCLNDITKPSTLLFIIHICEHYMFRLLRVIIRCLTNILKFLICNHFTK